MVAIGAAAGTQPAPHRMFNHPLLFSKSRDDELRDAAAWRVYELVNWVIEMKSAVPIPQAGDLFNQVRRKFIKIPRM